MGSRAIKRLTDRQRAIIIGKILGDGCLEKNGNHSRLKIEHGEKQKGYIFWLYKELLPFVPSKPRQVKVNTKGNWSTHWRFASYSISIFDQLRSVFYRNVKCIPSNIEELLENPLTLAVWYMDDGYKRTDCSGVYLCTSSFNNQDHYFLRLCLARNFGLKTNVHWAGKYPRIHLPSTQAWKFCQLIKPFVLKSFAYKLL